MQRPKKRTLLTFRDGLLGLLALSAISFFTDNPHVEAMSDAAWLILMLALLLEQNYQDKLSRQGKPAPPPGPQTHEHP